MCLLVQQTKETNFSDEFLTGVFLRNSDGIGVMWADDGKLMYHKALVASAGEFVAFYDDNIRGKACCWHARMKTHGDIDLTNCHPYPVFGFEGEDVPLPVLLMHNGVLATGNSNDTSKSDTWHYIRDFIRPMLNDNPELLHSAAFQKLLASHIGGGNKFALMDALGRTVIINRQAGVEYAGAWLSNTYAWDYYGLHPDMKHHKRQPTYSWPNQWASKAWTPPKHTVKRAPEPVPVKTKKRRVSKGKPATVNTSSTIDTTNVEIQEFLDTVLDANFELWESLTFEMVRRLIRGSSLRDPWDLLDMLVAQEIDDATFLDCVKHPHKIEDVRSELLDYQAAEDDYWDSVDYAYGTNKQKELDAQDDAQFQLSLR